MASVVPGPFDRVRPLDGEGQTVLAYFSGTGVAAVVKAIDGDHERVAAGLWSSLRPHPSLVSAAGLLAGGEGVVYDYVAPDAYSRKAQVRSAFERRLRRDPIAFPELLRLGVQACRGLEHAYASGVRGHGNLKPSNLLVGLDGGLRVSEPGMPGTESPVHMAPERFDGAPADESSDVYSLGVVLYQMVASGRPPFEAPAPGGSDPGLARFREDLHRLHKDALVPRLDSPLAALLERCLAKAPVGRLGMAALRAELEDLVRRETGLLPALPGSAEAAGWERAQQALALLATGRAEPALLAFDQALLALPPSAAVRAARATALHVAGRPEEAVATADEALAVDPQNAAAWQQKGVSLAALGRSDEAASALEQAAFLAPRDAAPRVALAVLLGRLRRLPQSLAAYDRAVAADPDHVDVWLERGKTLAEAGLRADAAGALLRFLDLTPAHHPARPRAEELLREAREGVAGTPVPQAAEPVVAREPTFVPEPVPSPEVASPSAAAPAPEPAFIPDSTESEPPAAAAPTPAYSPAWSADPPARGSDPEPEPAPRDAAGWSTRGVSLFKAGQLDRALHAFDQAIAADGRTAAHWANRASVLFRLGRSEDGLAGHARALALEPRLATSWFNKAMIEKALGRPAEAARSLLELLALAPPPDPRLVEQARSLLAEIEGQGVVQAPRGALGFLRAGLQAAEGGRLEEAAAAFENALACDPLLPGAWLFKGDALAHLGRDAQAAQAYEEGLTVDSTDTRLLLGFARARARLGDLDIAAAVLSRCLEIATGDSHQTAERLLAAVEARRRPAAAAPEPAAPEPPPPPALAPAAEPALAEAYEPSPELELPPETAAAPAPAPEPEPEAAAAPEPAFVPAPVPAAAPAEAAEPTLAAAHEPAPAPEPAPMRVAAPVQEPVAASAQEPRRAAAHEPADEPVRPVTALSTDAPPPAPVVTPSLPEVALRAAAVPAPAPQAAPASPTAVVPPPVPAPPASPRADPAGRAATLLAQGKPADALEVVEQALSAGSDDARVWLARGDCLRLLGRREEAAASYDQALKRAPRDPQAWIKKGEALDAAGVHGEAALCYDKALELHPRHIGAWNSKGVALTRLGRMQEALTCFIQALELDPRFALARFNRGAAEDVLGRAREAVSSFEAFLALATPSQRAQIQHAQKRLPVLKAQRT